MTAELFQLTQLSLLDSDEALKNCGTVDILHELLGLMMQELPNDLAVMKKAYTAHDAAKVEKTAHKIKDGAVYTGAVRMKYACEYLECYWKSGQRELFNALYHQAITTIEDTISYIEKWLHQQTKV